MEGIGQEKMPDRREGEDVAGLEVEALGPDAAASPKFGRALICICLRLGEVNPTYEKKVPCASGWHLPSVETCRHVISRNGPTRALSEWFHHRQHHDAYHQDRRHLIDNAIKFPGMPVVVAGKVAHPAHQQSVHSREHEDEKNLCLQPTGSKPATGKAEPETQRPDHQHRWVGDDLEESAFHHLERLGLLRAGRSVTVVDEEPG